MSPESGGSRPRGRKDRPIQELAQLTNEFAAVRVSLDTRGNGPRLLVENVETGSRILLSPLELASLTLADSDDRLGWLRVGEYRDDRPPAGRHGPSNGTGQG